MRDAIMAAQVRDNDDNTKDPRQRVLDELAKHDDQVRSFARALARDKDEVERWRRAIYRYVRGGQPRDDIAEEMALRLGYPPDYFKRPKTVPRRRQDHLRRLEAAVEALADRVAILEEHTEPPAAPAAESGG